MSRSDIVMAQVSRDIEKPDAPQKHKRRERLPRKLAKSAWDSPHVKHVRVAILAHPSKVAASNPLGICGRLVVSVGHGAMGGDHTATIAVWGGPLADKSEGRLNGKAGGCGYCKSSAAVADAFYRAGINEPSPLSADDVQTRKAISPPAGHGPERTYLLPRDLHGAGMGQVAKYFRGLGYIYESVIDAD